MMTWIMLFYDALEDYKLLSNEQFGRLIRAALLFAQDGTEPTFTGPEAYLWPGLKNRLLRDKESYAEKCQKNAENIRKRWNRKGKNPEQDGEPPPDQYDGIRSNTNVYESYQNKDKDKDEVKDKDESEVKSESNALEQLRADGYTNTEIDRALSRIPEGREIWNLRAYLKKAIDEERREKRDGKHVTAHNYAQRDYSGEQEEAMQRMIDEYNKQKEEAKNGEREEEGDGRRE